MKSNASKVLLVAVAVSAVFLAACSSAPRNSSTFSRGNAGQVQSVQMGTIQALREVTIESNRRLSSDTRAVEFTVRLDSGRTIAVVQPGSVNDYRVGDRVRVTNDGTTTRVAR